MLPPVLVLPSAGATLAPPAAPQLPLPLAAPQLPLPLAAPQLAEPEDAVPLSLPLVVSEVAALPPLLESVELDPPHAVRPRRAEAASAIEVLLVLVMVPLVWSRRRTSSSPRMARREPTNRRAVSPETGPAAKTPATRRRVHSSVQSAPPSLKSRRRPVTVTEPAIALTSDWETSMSTGPTPRQ